MEDTFKQALIVAWFAGCSTVPTHGQSMERYWIVWKEGEQLGGLVKQEADL